MQILLSKLLEEVFKMRGIFWIVVWLLSAAAQSGRGMNDALTWGSHLAQ